MIFILMDKLLEIKFLKYQIFIFFTKVFLATLDDELIEEDYDDIQEEKFSKTSQKGWLGISDKFWITSLIPPSGKEFKTTFDYKEKFRANFVRNRTY